MNNQAVPPQKSPRRLWIWLCIIVIGLAAAAVFFLWPKEEPAPVREPAKGVVGTITDNWDPQVSTPSQEGDTSEEPKKGTQIPGYSGAAMREGDMSLKIRIGNPPANHVGFIAVLKLKDGTVLYESPLLYPGQGLEEVLYESPLLYPGQGLEEVPLTQTLPKGTYAALVEYRCILLEDGKTPLNTAESGFTLYVS